MFQRGENVDVEYKREYVPELRKDVVAFANTTGGTIYVGIADNGDIVGVDSPDEIMLRISGSLKDSIVPDIMPFVQIRVGERDGKAIVKIEVAVGSARPYYIREKGLKPTGVYVRRGTSSQPLSDDGIRDMIVSSYGKSYESCRSLTQELTFSVLQNEMSARGIECTPVQQRTLNMIGEDGLFTNLALLLSDQCEHTLKMAVFQGAEDVVFRNRKEFRGSLLKQLEDGFDFLDQNIAIKSTIEGLRRNDVRDYPLEAIREALLNAIIHRDYSFSGSTLVSIYDDRIEFTSLGGIVPGLSMDAIMMGVSQSRNTGLANIFYRLRLVESYGTGIKRIQALYKVSHRQPIFETATGVFKVTLPNINHSSHKETPSLNRNRREKDTVLRIVADKGKVSRKDIEQALNVGATKAHSILRDMCREGVLLVDKAGRKTQYLATALVGA